MARIIAIEDSAALQRLLHITLRGTGCAVESHVTGGGGLAAAIANPPSVIILDLGLPDCSGWDVLEQLRSQPATAKTPIIVTTGQSLGAIAARAARHDVSTIEKPYTGATLRATVRLLMRERPEPVAVS